jgi:ATP-dependent DNA helicase RecG
LNEASEIKGLRRVDKLEIPLIALREALVNAVAHRDYLEKGARIMIEIFPNRVIISNPGGLLAGLSEKDFGKYSLSRNPIISDMLLRAGLIEKLGTGVNRIKSAILDAKLPEPEFHFNNFFSVTFFRERAVNTDLIGGQIGGQMGGQMNLGKLTDKQKQVLDIVRLDPKVSRAKLAKQLDINPSAVQKHLNVLKKRGDLKRVGTRHGYWVIVEGGTK